MSIFYNVTEQDLTKIFKLAQQQKNQRVEKTWNRFSKQTHTIQLAERFKPIIKN